MMTFHSTICEVYARTYTGDEGGLMGDSTRLFSTFAYNNVWVQKHISPAAKFHQLPPTNNSCIRHRVGLSSHRLPFSQSTVSRPPTTRHQRISKNGHLGVGFQLTASSCVTHTLVSIGSPALGARASNDAQVV